MRLTGVLFYAIALPLIYIQAFGGGDRFRDLQRSGSKPL